MIGQGLEPLHAVEKGARAILRVRRKLGAAEVTDHKGVTSQNKPGILGSRSVRDEQRNVFRRVPRRMQDGNRDVAEFEDVTVPNAVEWVSYVRTREQHVFGTSCFCRCAPDGNVIGMQVSVDDVPDLHSGLIGCVQIGLDVAKRINDRAYRFSAASKEIGCCDGFAVKELSKDHGYLLVMGTFQGPVVGPPQVR